MQGNENFITNHVDNIKQKALFLEREGYNVENVSEYTIKYSQKDKCNVEIFYGRYSDAADINVRFENKGISRPEQYSVGWFRNIKKFESGEKNIFRKAGEKVDMIADIFSLLEYLETNLDDVTNIDFCRKTQKKIDENFEKGVW